MHRAVVGRALVNSTRTARGFRDGGGISPANNIFHNFKQKQPSPDDRSAEHGGIGEHRKSGHLRPRCPFGRAQPQPDEKAKRGGSSANETVISTLHLHVQSPTNTAFSHY